MKSAHDVTQKAAHIQYEEYEKVRAQLTDSEIKVQSLQQQVDWFKRQLFGRKSEQHLLGHPDQGHLFAQINSEDLSPSPKKVVKGYTRSNKQKNDNNVNDSGLRFTDDVPTKVIDVPCPELEGGDGDN